MFLKNDMNFGTVEAGVLVRQGKSISLRINLNGSLDEITKSPYTTTIKDLIITLVGSYFLSLQSLIF